MFHVLRSGAGGRRQGGHDPIQGGLVVRGDAILARYNPPFTPWFLRRNEVLVPVARLDKR